MSIYGHIESLRQKAEQLNQLIFQESKRPHPNETLLHELKTKRLKIKEELLQLNAL